MSEVKGFNGKYRFLSNFYPSKVTLDGLEYDTVEAAFQAAKTDDVADRRAIREADKPAEAKRLGRKVTLRQDWEKVKIGVMEDLCRQKFKQAAFKEKLLATGDAYLEETNTWNDTFWGVCRGHGKNHLGKVLMKLRDELRAS